MEEGRGGYEKRQEKLEFKLSSIKGANKIANVLVKKRWCWISGRTHKKKERKCNQRSSAKKTRLPKPSPIFSISVLTKIKGDDWAYQC